MGDKGGSSSSRRGRMKMRTVGTRSSVHRTSGISAKSVIDSKSGRTSTAHSSTKVEASGGEKRERMAALSAMEHCFMR